MNITITWKDGEQRTLDDVVAFSKSWHHDEWVFKCDFRDGSSDTYTGKRLMVTAGSEVNGQTHSAEVNDG